MEGVVASIKPVHSLVAAVMEGVGEPVLLVDGAASPHAYSMRPSEARALEQARLVFWIGEGMEAFLVKPLETLASSATTVELSKAEGLVELGLREGGTFEAHGHEHGEEGHEDGEDSHEHHEAGADAEHASAIDMHFWLDPENAKIFAREIADALAAADASNAEVYRKNAAALSRKLDALIAETEAALAPVRDKTFVVFHDAYHYYEARFGIDAAASITVSPEAIPGAGRVAEIKALIEEAQATCVFSEPQFEPSLVAVVTEDTQARSAVLDPLGSELEAGPDLYFDLIRNLTTSLTTCFGASLAPAQ
jgi:zinc transport system substrate-binding protein